MKHPYSVLRPEYELLLSTMRVTRAAEVDHAAKGLLRNRDRYAQVGDLTGVPAAMLAVLHMRESNANFGTYLGNGQTLDRVTTIVPKGRGPWPSWEAGAIDAINYDRLNDNSAPWSLSYACWKGEAWNGFGPRNHGIHTGYLWAGSNHYGRGKYVADGKWDAWHVDRQLGMIPVMRRMIELDPSLDFANQPTPEVASPVLVPPMIVPVGLGAAPVGTRWIQDALNKTIDAGLLVDGSYGRRTRAAVREFQTRRGITVDGLAGPETLRHLELALVEAKASS